MNISAQIAERAKRAIEERVFPGCVVAIVRTGEREILPFGTIDYRGTLVREDTIYDLASITKSIPVAALAALLIHEKKITLADLVRTWIPELQNDHAATIEDLLRYRVGGIRMSELAALSPKEIMAQVCTIGLTHPGEEKYTNLPAYLLGIILERVTGKTLDVLAREYLFEPLSMSTTSFCQAVGAAPTEIVEGSVVRDIVHDESARAFARSGIAVGHAGLFSTAPDLANFVESMLGGDYPAVVRAAQKGLGWALNQGWYMGTHFGPRTFGKTGFTGTSIVCDCDRGVALIILANRTYPARPLSDDPISAFRREIAEVVFAPK